MNSSSRTAISCLSMLVGLIAPIAVQASGTWTKIANTPPAFVSNAVLLTDGTVMCADGGKNWYRLTPDIHGSYVNGTWSQLASMNDSRLYYSSDVLTNGNVYVCGGEYGTGSSKSEIYNSLANTWTEGPNSQITVGFIDAMSVVLRDGTVLDASSGTGHQIYNPFTNSFGAAFNSLRGMDEADWAKLPDDSILAVDGTGGQTSERYIPSLGAWVADAPLPVTLWGWGGEIGSANLLPNGKVLDIGGSSITALYTPSGNNTPGSWTTGPAIPNSLGAIDAPAAALVTGNLLCAVGPNNSYDPPTSFFEYDYTANTFTQINGPTGITDNSSPYVTSMLDLPDGSVMYQSSTGLFFYKPNGSPLAQGQPVIQSVSQNANGSYHLTGTGLNGISQGARYGDDKQMDSNYPIVRLTNNANGNVYFGRTFNWTSMVMTGSRSLSTDFTLPTGLPSAVYSLAVIANGNASAPVTFSTATSTESPFGGTPAPVPGTVQAENYDTGGQSVAYNVTSVNGSGNAYRTDGVDLEATTDVGGGLDVGWSAPGQWFRYTVNVATAGIYTVTFRVASLSTGGTIHLVDQNGKSLTGAVTIPSTGGWQTWTNVTANVTLAAGKQIIQLEQDAGGFNVNHMTFAGNSVTIPSIPTGVAATAGNAQVSLTWNASSGATSYNVYRSTTPGGEGTTAYKTGLTGTSLVDTGLTNGVTYYYRVAAVNSAGTSAQSTEVSATPTGGNGGSGPATFTAGPTSGSGPYYSEEDVTINSPASITALTATVTIQKTAGVTYSGQYSTYGSMTMTHVDNGSTIVFTYTLPAGQSMNGGTTFTFGSQIGGNGTAHPYPGDTYTVTYTTGGVSYTKTGVM